jgi:hypothetical protein
MTQQVLPIPKEKAIEIGEFLTNNVSRAVVYSLLHNQPLTRREIERSPLTESMRRLSLSAQTRPLKDKSTVQMRTLLSKGVDCGVLIPINSKRQNYYFLNSDLRIEPAPIREGQDTSDVVALTAYLDRSYAHMPGQAVLPGWGTAADHTVLPVPYIDTPKSLMLWLSWLITPTRREVMGHIADQGHTTRPKLRSELGFWADRIVAKEGMPSGVLERDGEKIRYQFSSFSFSKLKMKKEEETGKKKSWTAYPPSFWLTRTYEPLKCIMGASRYLGDKKPDATPAMVLEELAKENPTIVEKNRREFLEINFIERMSFYAIYHSSGDPAVKFSAESLVPEKVTYNAPEHPLLWISRTDDEHGAKLDFKHEAALMLLSKKTKDDQIVYLEKMLKDIAYERIGKLIDDHERKLEKDLDKLRVQSFGLGTESLTAVAGLELTREQILAEREHFEKFMNILVPGSIPKRKKATTEELIKAVEDEKALETREPSAEQDRDKH